MAAGEDQPQPVVLDPLVLPRRGILGLGVEPRGELRLRGVEAGAAADAVDGLEAAGRNQPRPGVGGHAIPRPLLERRREGIVQRVLGEVEVAEHADEGGEDAARVGAVDRVHRLARLFGRVPAHLPCLPRMISPANILALGRVRPYAPFSRERVLRGSGFLALRRRLGDRLVVPIALVGIAVDLEHRLSGALRAVLLYSSTLEFRPSASAGVARQSWPRTITYRKDRS